MTLYVTEFTNLGKDANGNMSIYPVQPATATQTLAVTGVSAALASAFAASTTVVQVHTDAICSVVFGSAPTATVTNARFAANETRYFCVPLASGLKIAAILNT